MAKLARQKLQSFIKGMSQKVQLIASVIPRPKLLILDEPFPGLDPVSAESIRSAVLDLRAIFMIYHGNNVWDEHDPRVDWRWNQ